jgi:hypothetical protein
MTDLAGFLIFIVPMPYLFSIRHETEKSKTSYNVPHVHTDLQNTSFSPFSKRQKNQEDKEKNVSHSLA